ncbi:MAG: hypothetical protein H6634_15425 [Anaerolineales bacterium]|nr:hypothetical protein [Anaerolineales bacterium]
MWEALANWLTKRFSSPLPVLFFLLGSILIIVEAIEVKLPDGTQVLRANEFGKLILSLGILALVVAAMFQIFDRNSKLERKARELDILEAKTYSTLRELMHEYVSQPGGLDFGACIYRENIYHDISADQFAKRLVHFRVQRNLELQTQHYLEFGREIYALVDPINSRMNDLQQGQLFRVILDVEKGGFFFHQISDGCYVIGATVNQEAMDDNSADLEMRSLVRAVEHHIAKLENQ